jgi:hypothetical protein
MNNTFAYIVCNGCRRIEYASESFVDFNLNDLTENPKQTMRLLKQYFQDRGWSTSRGYDLCPSCVIKGETHG